MLLSAVVMNAKGWERNLIPADELMGTEQNYSRIYFSDDGGFGYYEDSNIIFISTFDGIFDYNEKGEVKSVVIGFYDLNGNLVDRINFGEFTVSEDNSSFALSFSLWKNDMVVDYLNKKTGYVRFVADRYGECDFDIKVPCFNNSKKSTASAKRKTAKRNRK